MTCTTTETAPAAAITVGVVICAYTELRWDDLISAVRAVVGMLGDDDRVVVVVDHNEALLKRLEASVPSGVLVTPNTGRQGLSDSRNSGVAALNSDVVLFLDDDALPDPGWLEAFRIQFAIPEVVAVGGAIRPEWEGGVPPGWFPPEFGWVIGCDYRGLPGDGAEIRNPIGASMAVRRAQIHEVGGFSTRVGRVGAKPVGNEETELAIKIRQANPNCRIVRSTLPVVAHRVPRSRQTLNYFVSRCYFEGISKAALSTSVGSHDGLSAEVAYLTRTLASGVILHLRSVLRGDWAALARACLIPAGLLITSTGYVVGRCRVPRGQVAAGAPQQQAPQQQAPHPNLPSLPE